MLSYKPEDNTEGAPLVADTSDLIGPSTDQAVQSLFEVLSASPEFTSPDFPMSEYLTSPWDDSPLDDMLTTPGLGSDMLTSPFLADSGDVPEMELFGGLSAYEMLLPKESPAPSTPGLDLENMYTMPSSVTPSLNPTSVYSSPQVPTTPSFSTIRTSTTQRKSSATGTRKNLTPDALVPLDAPTQPRKYRIPSATSRKELPAVFAKKRARSQVFPDEEDELYDEQNLLPPNATEKEQIEWKRRQNTLAARKSRKRKLQHQLELENAVEQLSVEKETWKVRALTYQALLRNHGLEVPEFN
jgi:hypothetical protein